MKTDLKLFALLLVFSGAQLSWAEKKPNPTVGLATFNAALTPRVGNYEARRQKIPKKLAKLNAKVACLQEVYFSRDVVAIISAMEEEGRFPYIYSGAHDAVSELKGDFTSGVPCSSYQFFSDFLPCFIGNCSTIPDEMARLGCAVVNCSMLELAQECVSCLTLANPADAIATCAGVDGEYRVNVGGVMLVSDRQLSNVQIARYDSGTFFLPRVYIFAEVEGIGNILCTHQTANLGDYYFEVNLQGTYSSWADQNLAEAEKVVEKLAPYSQAIVMGDLNTSPDLPGNGISPDMPASLNFYLANGFASPYTTNGPANCTFCAHNPIALTTEDFILDYILTKSTQYSDVERILDEYDADIPGFLSDHHGVGMKFNKKNLNQP